MNFAPAGDQRVFVDQAPDLMLGHPRIMFEFQRGQPTIVIADIEIFRLHLDANSAYQATVTSLAEARP